MTQDSAAWKEMTGALHKGDASDLNLYIHNLEFPLLGWCASLLFAFKLQRLL